MKPKTQRKVIYVDGCRERIQGSRVGSCPYTRHYGNALGCQYKYGALPQNGFPEWCPLQNEKQEQ